MTTEIVEKPRQRKSVDYQNGKIYQIVNSINDKIYIGSCSTDLRIRFHKHKSEALNNFLNVNRKFYDFYRENVDEFKIVLIENFPCNSKNELEKREFEILKEKIKELGRDTIYNLSLSQNGVGHHMHGKGGEQHNFYGKYHTEESKQKMSESKKGKYTGKESSNFGKKLSEETKQKISDYNKGKNLGKKSPCFKGGSIYIHKNCWIFSYMMDGKQKSKSHSINKYGEENAHRLCLEIQKTIYPELNHNTFLVS